MVLVTGAVGCAGYGVILILLGLLVLGLGDYPTLSDTVTSSIFFGALAVGGLVVLGAVLARLNRRWWLRGPLLAAWPVYLFAAISAYNTIWPRSADANSAPYDRHDWLLTVGPVAVALAITIAASFIASRRGRPRPDLTPALAAAMDGSVKGNTPALTLGPPLDAVGVHIRPGLSAWIIEAGRALAAAFSVLIGLPMERPADVSGDGKFKWDGERWVPVENSQPQPRQSLADEGPHLGHRDGSSGS